MKANFCLNCGNKMETRDINGTDRRACPACEFVLWGDYSIGVGALVMKDDKVLLVRRMEDPGKGLWTNPGGYSEQLESIDQTVVREVLEETGVTTKVKSVVAIRDLPREVHNVYITFAMEYVEGEPVPDGVEVDKAGFYSLQEMETMSVAGLTRILVNTALQGQTNGLEYSKDPYKDARLFSIPTSGE
ncbi:ADP-ribose pyrophosphatase YjhB (NUDIX family) [Scopulibacillus darangshiensis]|uniref:ADP-ribose pyrophosphatase YjhB (NUDIX family) n=1 Tax=Scopulibacillus darangshiensis TaxID=442528 RepID=A0A4R2P5F6_9BACL|nr:NUDIX domain-containing protein [Scopulibacillus darangshiensis]TCP29917.1 ADP-ribose pyrophosphatase YjhB (NUDIX family) [Scopulibacillus darangshiensis]